MLRFLEQLLTPVCLSLLLLAIAGLAYKRPGLRRTLAWAAIAVLLAGGNDWIGRWIALPLERRYAAPDPLPRADAIVVLGGAIPVREYPRHTIEVSEAGDRVLYAFELFQKKNAQFILCAAGGASTRPPPGEAEQMRTLLESFGVPCEAILVETNSTSTLENASFSRPLIEAKQIHRMLLVTSAVHMPRALAVFRNQYPDLETIPAPTDYMFTDKPKLRVKDIVEGFIPSAEHFAHMEQALHEYFGLAYYWAKGWL